MLCSAYVGNLSTLLGPCNRQVIPMLPCIPQRQTRGYDTDSDHFQYRPSPSSDWTSSQVSQLVSQIQLYIRSFRLAIPNHAVPSSSALPKCLSRTGYEFSMSRFQTFLICHPLQDLTQTPPTAHPRISPRHPLAFSHP